MRNYDKENFTGKYDTRNEALYIGDVLYIGNTGLKVQVVSKTDCLPLKDPSCVKIPLTEILTSSRVYLVNSLGKSDDSDVSENTLAAAALEQHYRQEEADASDFLNNYTGRYLNVHTMICFGDRFRISGKIQGVWEVRDLLVSGYCQRDWLVSLSEELVPTIMSLDAVLASPEYQLEKVAVVHEVK